MKFTRTAAALTASSLALCGLTFTVFAEDGKNSSDIVILYTNDVHCGIDQNIGYDGLALYKREMQAEYEHVILVDAGDAIQGASIGTLSKGEYITRLMNAVGYDAATVGNHEFDYGMSELMVRADELSCGYVCANLYNKAGQTVFDPYRVIKAGDKKIAFVGAATPESLLQSTPVNFRDESGEYIYSFGEDGTVYERLQKAIDDAKAEGSDYVILLAHLGENDVTEGWSAQAVTSQLTGIDAVIDGHSHDVTRALAAKTKDGKEITITQTGTKLENIGKMTISADGRITTELIDSVPAPDDNSGIAEDIWLEPDGREGRFVDEAVNREMLLIEDEFAEILNEVIGNTEFDLVDSDPITGERLVRKAETNLGDLCADAYKYVLGADVGIVNGGGIRASIAAGDITYNDAMSVFPFGNMVSVAEVTGQQILDMLEVGVMSYPEENGSFIHVSGIQYQIAAKNTPSSVKLDEKGTFLGVEGRYRVIGVKINGELLDKDKTYTLATHDYFLKNGGDGYILSGKCNIIKDDVMTDSDLIAIYIRDFLVRGIPEEYREPYGEGRIFSWDKTDEDVDAVSAEIPAEAPESDADDTQMISLEESGNPSTGTGDSVAFALCGISLLAAAASVKRHGREYRRK